MFDLLRARCEKYIMDISDRSFTPRLFSLESCLTLFSKGYGLSVAFHQHLYQKGVLKRRRLPCPVVSIGNIVAGGSGKTPMAVYTADLFRQAGKNPTVISRGYKGDHDGTPLIVSDGRNIFSGAETAGDEPVLMANRRSFPVVVGTDRYRAGLHALGHLNPRPDVLILDDGFQHLKLEKDLDILLFDGTRPLGNHRLLPAGRLREAPGRAGRQPDMIVFTRCDDIEKGRKHRDQIRRLYPGCPAFTSRHVPVVMRWQSRKNPDSLYSESVPVTFFKEKTAFLFSGLARNDSFYRTVAGLGIKIRYHLEFRDHYRYKRADLRRIQDRALKTGADMILTTEKDWVKLDPDMTWDLDLGVIGVRIEMDEPDRFAGFLLSRLEHICRTNTFTSC